MRQERVSRRTRAIISQGQGFNMQATHLAESLPLELLAFTDCLALEEQDLSLLRLVVELSLLELGFQICNLLVVVALGIVRLEAGNLSGKTGANSATRSKSSLGVTELLEWRTSSIEFLGQSPGEGTSEIVQISKSIGDYMVLLV